MRNLLIASANKGKVKEIKELFSDLALNIIDLSNYPYLQEVKEDGKTFRDNALKKARIRSQETALLTMADDSGLEVEYLSGKPGIYSARFAGPDADDEENNKKLLKELAGVPYEKRQARFKCVVAIIDPVSGEEYTVQGICEGRILTELRGTNGFGYDPLFYVPEYNKTMAELKLTAKNKISHRAHALVKAKEILNKLV